MQVQKRQLSQTFRGICNTRLTHFKLIPICQALQASSFRNRSIWPKGAGLDTNTAEINLSFTNQFTNSHSVPTDNVCGLLDQKVKQFFLNPIRSCYKLPTCAAVHGKSILCLWFYSQPGSRYWHCANLASFFGPLLLWQLCSQIWSVLIVLGGRSLGISITVVL